MKRKLAVIGYGGMGSWHCKSITEKIDAIEVKGIYDIRPEACEKAIKDGYYTYSSVEELLQDDEVELVTIAVPNNFHKDYSIACLRAGKNVICEKPVTMNSEELKEIISVSKETGKIFTVHQNRRWDKDYQMVKRILADGTIGKPYYIESRVQGSRRMLHGWRGYQENGGGMVYDWGVHLFDQLLNMIDSPVVSVTAHLITLFSNEVDDNFKVFLNFDNGISAIVEVATNCFINQPRWHICGSNGTVEIKNWDLDGEIVTLGSDEIMKWEDDIVYTAAGPTRTMAPRPEHTIERHQLPIVEGGWVSFYNNVVDVLDNKAELAVKPEQALRVMTLIDFIFDTAKAGKPQSCRI